MTRWDLVHKWSDPEAQSLVDAVTSALENCDRKLTEAEAAQAGPPPLDVPAVYKPIIKALTYPCREPIHREAAAVLARLSRGEPGR